MAGDIDLGVDIILRRWEYILRWREGLFRRWEDVLRTLGIEN